MRPSFEFDVVVVGGGAAGCACVAHLCGLGDLRICLVEAGPDYGPASRGAWPADLLDPRRLPASHDWGFAEQREDAQLPEPRAKVIGGCSTHNQCAAVWGLPSDYDRWADLGDDSSWSYDALRPLFNELEQAEAGVPAYRGRGGLLPTRAYREQELASWQRTFLDAAQERGYGWVADLSSPEPAEGAGAFQVNIHDDQRWNAAFAFLDPLREQRSLIILDRLLADRLLFHDGQAEAVLCRRGGEQVELRARQFVLAAGTYGSPAILLRSGIGPAADLERLGIDLVGEVDGVGANLHDHPGVAIEFAPSPAAHRELAVDLATGRFHQSQAVLRAQGHSLHVLPYQAAREGERWSFHLVAFAMAPASRGVLSLRSKDPSASPRIEFDFLSDADGADLMILRDGVAEIRRLAATRALAERAQMSSDFDRKPVVNSDAAIRANVTGYGHAVGTCRLGPSNDPEAVADVDGLVRTTTNVRVADASFMPVIPAANTNLTAMLIGWRLAEPVAAAAH